jgi:hypothetical protein
MPYFVADTHSAISPIRRLFDARHATTRVRHFYDISLATPSPRAQFFISSPSRAYFQPIFFTTVYITTTLPTPPTIAAIFASFCSVLSFISRRVAIFADAPMKVVSAHAISPAAIFATPLSPAERHAAKDAELFTIRITPRHAEDA